MAQIVRHDASVNRVAGGEERLSMELGEGGLSLSLLGLGGIQALACLTQSGMKDLPFRRLHASGVHRCSLVAGP
jgi:hypothetical protein